MKEAKEVKKTETKKTTPTKPAKTKTPVKKAPAKPVIKLNPNMSYTQEVKKVEKKVSPESLKKYMSARLLEMEERYWKVVDVLEQCYKRMDSMKERITKDSETMEDMAKNLLLKDNMLKTTEKQRDKANSHLAKVIAVKDLFKEQLEEYRGESSCGEECQCEDSEKKIEITTRGKISKEDAKELGEKVAKYANKLMKEASIK